jgi:hypothetical protein
MLSVGRVEEVTPDLHWSLLPCKVQRSVVLSSGSRFQVHMQWSLALLLPKVHEVGMLSVVGFELIVCKLWLIEMDRIDRQSVDKELVSLPFIFELGLQLSLIELELFNSFIWPGPFDFVFMELVMTSSGSYVFRKNGDAKETSTVVAEIAADIECTVAKLVVWIIEVEALVAICDLAAIVWSYIGDDVGPQEELESRKLFHGQASSGQVSCVNEVDSFSLEEQVHVVEISIMLLTSLLKQRNVVDEGVTSREDLHLNSWPFT